MNPPPLIQRELMLISEVFRRHPEIPFVKLSGSRAQGSHTPCSDVDLALWGVDVIGAEAIAAELDELPLPYQFDVTPFALIKQNSLRQHIERVGVALPRCGENFNSSK